MPFALPPDFQNGSIAELAAFINSDQPPPVDQWHPSHRGRIDINIAADGRWFHEGGEIRRPEMVRLFSRILRREQDGSYVLVTPAECLTITVADAPFVAVNMRVEGRGGPGQQLIFRLNSEEIVIAGPDHPLVLRNGPAGHLPYLLVRGTVDRPLEARLARPVYYDLAEQADARGCVLSSGMMHVVGDLG